MKVLHGEWFASRPFRGGIQRLRPKAPESIAFGEEVDEAAARRPHGITIRSASGRDWNPARFRSSAPTAERRREDLALRLANHGLEQNPAFVGRHAGEPDRVFRVLHEHVIAT